MSWKVYMRQGEVAEALTNLGEAAEHYARALSVARGLDEQDGAEEALRRVEVAADSVRSSR